MEIRLVKLITGDSFVAEMIEEGSDYVVFDGAFMIVPTPNGQMAMIPFLFGAKNDVFSIVQEHIVYNLEASDQLCNIYKEHTNKGVLTPGSLLV